LSSCALFFSSPQDCNSSLFIKATSNLESKTTR